MEREPAVFEVAMVVCSFKFAVARAEVGTSLAPSCVPWVVCCTSTVWIHAQSRVVFLEFAVMLSSVLRFNKLRTEQRAFEFAIAGAQLGTKFSTEQCSVEFVFA